MAALFTRIVLSLITVLLLVLLDEIAGGHYLHYGLLLQGLVYSMIAINLIMVVLNLQTMSTYYGHDTTDIDC